MKLDEIAKRITAHLKRFEADPKINKGLAEKKLRPYFNPYAVRVGRYVMITFVSYQGGRSYSKEWAEAYLRWLDAGNVGKPWNMPDKFEVTNG